MTVPTQTPPDNPPLSDRSPICFVDTETDGIHPARQPWEVAIVRREPDGSETCYEAMLPINLSTADPFGLRVGRFYERHPLGRRLAGGNDPNQAWMVGLADPHRAALDIAAITHGAHIIGAVPSFDTETLDRLLRAQGLIPAWHYHLGDVENFAVGWLAGRGTVLLPPWSSKDLGARLGVKPASDAEKHTAMGDVRWAMRMWDAIMTVPGPQPAVTS